MDETVFQAMYRDLNAKKPKALRREGILPAVIYGSHIQPTAITLDMKTANRVLPRVTSSQLVVIQLEDQKLTTLVRERQRNPLTGSLIHVDFQAVSMTEKLRAKVSIVLQGESPAVKAGLGVLVTGVEEIDVESLPADLPNQIYIDISSLANIGDNIHVNDLVLPGAVAVLTRSDELIALITPPEAEEKEEEVVVAAVEPEVIEKGKKEELEEKPA